MIGPSIAGPTATELQSLVDGLGRQLARAVELEDAHGRLLAFNSQHGSLDDIRRTSILERKSPAACLRWAHGHGIREAVSPLRLPRNPTLGMEPRICAPVRLRGRLFGHLWLIDPGEDLTDAGVGAVQAAAERAAEILDAAKLSADGTRGKSRELLKKLLSDDPGVRASAAEDLVDSELFVGSAPVAVLIVMAGRRDAGDDGRAWRIAIAAALREAARTLSPGHVLTEARADDGVLLVAEQVPSLRGRTLHALAELLERAAAEHVRGQSIVGVGDVQPALSAARESYQQALAAARIARAFPKFGVVAEWGELGVYRLLNQFPKVLTVENLHTGLARLIRAPGGDALIETLERYLDLGCDAQRTAAELGLHRTSLYQRLEKIEGLAAVDMHDGEQRLALHISLKLARLSHLLTDN
jgi:hypothetical protein